MTGPEHYQEAEKFLGYAGEYDAARKLVQAVRRAGGQAERTGRGQIKITGPAGSVTIHEPSADTRRDLRSDSAIQKITEATGLDLAD